MKTKKVITLLTLLLMAGVFVSAQTYSDSNKQKSETTKGQFQASEKPGTPDFITSFGVWYQLLKVRYVSDFYSDVIIQSDDNTVNRRRQFQHQPVEDHPGDPRPSRYFHLNRNETHVAN